MVDKGQVERMRQLGLYGQEDSDLRSVLDRHSALLGRLAADPYIGGILFGMEAVNIGEALIARATSTLTLSTSAQSIVGDGDSTKVRLLLPTLGRWLIEAICDFQVTTADAGNVCIGELFVDGSAEAAQVLKSMRSLDRATVGQEWVATTTAVNTPVELKAKKSGAGGTATATAIHTVLTAIRTR